tara:strand:- start:1355 stop:1633 length:279 start_codon:yes stop_codon:yes gene_type:complete
MGLETHSMVEIKERFHKEDKALPYMFWEHGTLWIDTNDKSDIDTIKDVMKTEVLAPGCDVQFNCLKATETEPWDQWAMDIIHKNSDFLEVDK